MRGYTVYAGCLTEKGMAVLLARAKAAALVQEKGEGKKGGKGDGDWDMYAVTLFTAKVCLALCPLTRFFRTATASAEAFEDPDLLGLGLQPPQEGSGRTAYGSFFEMLATNMTLWKEGISKAAELRVDLDRLIYFPLEPAGFRSCFPVEEGFLWEGHLFVLHAVFYHSVVGAARGRGNRHITADVGYHGQIFYFNDLTTNPLMHPRTKPGWTFEGASRKNFETCGLLYVRVDKEEVLAAAAAGSGAVAMDVDDEVEEGAGGDGGEEGS